MISESNDAYSPDVEVIATSTGLPASFGGDDTTDTELPFALRDDAQDQKGYFDWFGIGSKRSKIIVGLSTFLLVLCVSTGIGIAAKNNTVSNFAVLEVRGTRALEVHVTLWSGRTSIFSSFSTNLATNEEDCPEPLLISSTTTKGSKAPSTVKAKSKAPSSAEAEGGTRAHTTPGSKCSKSTKSPKSSKAPSSQPSLAPSASVKPSVKPSFRPSGSPSTKPSLAPSESVKPSAKPSLVPSGSPSTKPSLRPSDSPSAKPSLIPSAKPSLGPSAKPSLGPSAKPSLIPSAKPSLGPSAKPSLGPSAKPSLIPSAKPSLGPSAKPSLVPSAKPSLSLVPSESPSTKPTVTCIATREFCDRTGSGARDYCRNTACCAGTFRNCNSLTNAPGLYCGRRSCPAAGRRIASGKFCGRAQNQAANFCRSACRAGNSRNCPNSPLPGRYCDNSVPCPV